MGKRQLGELEVGELVSTLLISEVAALPIADPDIPLMNAVIPILFIVCLEIVISSIKNKSERLKKYIEGKPIFLIYKGKLKQNALAENRISINELLCETRMQGFGDINDVYYAVLEQNGKLSIFEKKENNSFTHTIIVDAEINSSVLDRLGYDEIWLKNQLKMHEVKKDDVFLMTVNDEGKTNIIKKEETCEDC
jgi:uncharacterized membrane protein YcaP (DUF421 family)